MTALRRSLRAWFDRAKRDLPWRRSQDPYRIWLSEIMLQQTTVAAVVAYFERFTAAYPTVADLAAADEHDVLRLWEGLGYYRRARQLHAAALVIAAEHGGTFPADPEAVRKLPGIGRYTAGAILSIAFDRPEPILEANTVRLLSRLSAFRGDPLARDGQTWLWSLAAQLVPTKEPGLFNQALMELGALVCTPRDPKCGACPVVKLCPTRALGLQNEIPRPKKKPTFEDVRAAAVLIRRADQKLLLVQYAAGKRWGGLWDFPRYEVSAEQPAGIVSELQTKIKATLGVDVRLGEVRTALKHGVTRFRITLDAYDAEQVGGRLQVREFADARWVRPAELRNFALNTTGRKLAKLVSGQ
ncbi:MAG: A/G-specific adenine glycosylase [Planctomycetales bacterium]|nr:A/G-specific adenine glycosylase [Planctomycetales bacterium]